MATIIAIMLGMALLIALVRALYLVGRSLWWADEAIDEPDAIDESKRPPPRLESDRVAEGDDDEDLASPKERGPGAEDETPSDDSST